MPSIPFNSVQVRDLQAIILGTGEFAFSPLSTTVAQAQAAGYIDFGNIVATGLKPKLTTVDHWGSYRGVLRRDQIRGTKAIVGYTLKCDEWDLTKVEIAMFGEASTAFTQTAISVATAADALNFTALAPGVANRWYDVTKTGVRVRELLTLTCTGLVENTDFFVDYKMGRVRFASAQTATITPQITASGVSAGQTANLQCLTPASTFIRTGMGRLSLFDDSHPNKLVYDHVDFGCQIALTNGGDFDGTKLAEMELEVSLTSPVGSIYVAEALTQ